MITDRIQGKNQPENADYSQTIPENCPTLVSTQVTPGVILDQFFAKELVENQVISVPQFGTHQTLVQTWCDCQDSR